MSISRKLIGVGVDEPAYVDDLYAGTLHEGNVSSSYANPPLYVESGVSLVDAPEATSFSYGGVGSVSSGYSVPSDLVDFSFLPFTVEFWIKPLGAFNTTSTFLDTRAESVDEGFIFWNQYGVFKINFYGAEIWTFAYDLAGLHANQWTHVALTRNGRYYNLFINGTRVYSAQSPTSNTFKANGATSVVGGFSGYPGYGFNNCLVSDFRVTMKKDISAAETTYPVPTRYLKPSDVKETTVLVFTPDSFAPGAAVTTCPDRWTQTAYPKYATTNSVVASADGPFDETFPEVEGDGGMVLGTATSVRVIHDTDMPADRILSPYTNSGEYDIGCEIKYGPEGHVVQGTPLTNHTNVFTDYTFKKSRNFFDMVRYTGDGVAGREVAHRLGSKPGMMWVKNTSSTANWRVYHTSVGADYWLELNETSDKVGPSDAIWNSVEPTDLAFTVGSSTTINGLGEEYVAYIFAENNADNGRMRCGRYLGDGNADGPEVDLGWEPQLVLIKRDDSTGPWALLDANGWRTDGADPYIDLPGLDAPITTTDVLDVTGTGFKVKTDSADFNATGGGYVYMAVRRLDKPAEEFEPEELFSTVVGTNGPFEHEFPVDMAWYKGPALTNSGGILTTRLTDYEYVDTSSSAAAVANSSHGYDPVEGYGTSGNFAGYNSWGFRRAPGFFDVVVQDGASDRVFNHSLSVPPELILLKSRSSTQAWYGYAEPYGSGTLYLTSDAPNPAQTGWATTDTTFTGADGIISPGVSYLSLLWASVPGLCDIGSYTGTGADVNVDCGFTNGARFVLVKRTDAAGDWYYWDTVRGIVTGNDPYLLLNSPAAQVTTDYIDPLASGFTITAAAPAALNNVGGEYIYMAIA